MRERDVNRTTKISDSFRMETNYNLSDIVIDILYSKY